MKTDNTKFSKTVLFFLTALCCAVALAILSNFIAGFIPYHLISAGVFAMLLGMALNPLIQKFLDKKCSEKSQKGYAKGLAFVSKTVLKAGIVLMGFTLSFAQVLHVGKFSLIVMSFTLVAAFGFGNLFGKIFKMNWKLSNLISAGTGICGAVHGAGVPCGGQISHRPGGREGVRQRRLYRGVSPPGGVRPVERRPLLLDRHHRPEPGHLPVPEAE